MSAFATCVSHCDALICLHWLRVSERIRFILTVLVNRSLHGLSINCVPLSAFFARRRRIFSVSRDLPRVPRCQLSAVGNHAFPVAVAAIWNYLLSDVTSCSVFLFRSRYKTLLFSYSFPGAIVCLYCLSCLSIYVI